MDQKTRMEVRLIKYQDYIEKHPENAYGYYSLGVLYFMCGNFKQANKMYLNALEKDCHYSRAKLGLLEVMLEEGKYVSAAQYYTMNQYDLTKKKIFIVKLNRIMNQFYDHLSRSYQRNLIFSIRFTLSINGLIKMFNKNQDNVIVHFLLAMYYLHEDRLKEKALVLYHLCVTNEGISDRIRWEMVSSLSKEHKQILKDSNIAASFDSIPPDTFNTEYSNFILSQFLAKEDKNRIENAIVYMIKNNISIEDKTLWKYVMWCKKANIEDTTLAMACEKLVCSGWIDKYLAETLIKLKSLNCYTDASRVDRILDVYGYSA